MSENDQVTVVPANELEKNAAMNTDGTPAEMKLDAILDVSVSPCVEVGDLRMPIRNLLQLGQGSVVELERMAGEALDVYVNGTLLAKGEVVVKSERMGVRLTEIVSPSERIKRLR